jgi:uncharacterized protein YciI
MNPTAAAALSALLLTAFASAAGAQPKPPYAGPKSVVGHALPAGCPEHDPLAEAAACSAHADAATDAWLLVGANRETFLLHHLPPGLADGLRARAGRPVEVAGDFRWQGKLRTLRPESVRAADEAAFEAAKAAEPEYVMKGFYMTILRPGPKQPGFSDAEKQELMKGHFGHIQRQAEAGTLLIAGPFGEQKPERLFSGIYLYEVGSLERAEALTGEDPAFQAGYFSAVTIPWFGPASLSF